MSNKTSKPKLTASQLYEKMRDEKGITFRYDAEDEVVTYLSDSNNYLRTACYRVSFTKYQAGKNKGKYIDLDFAYLKELSVIDMHYRFMVLRMCSDIEHALSVSLMKQIENDPLTDGYDIVDQFLSQYPIVVKNLERSISSPHTGDLIKKYFTLSVNSTAGSGRNTNITALDDCPAWVLIECMTFGDLLSFYQFYTQLRGTAMAVSKPVMNLVRSLRNGAAHNNCLLCNIPSGSSVPPRELNTAIQHLNLVSASQRQNRLSSRAALEFTALAYTYSIIVHGKVREHRIRELKKLFYGRMIENKGFFRNNALITASYRFCCKMMEGFLP